MRALILSLACVAAFVAADTHAQNWRNTRGSNWNDGFGWTSSRPGRSCGEPPSTSLSVWLDARNVDGSNNATLANNDPVTTWQDLGSINDDPTQAVAGAKPTYIASCVGGKACVRFDGGDRLTATTAANYTFMSNGSDHTAYVVWTASTANPNLGYSLVSTAQVIGSAASRGTGMMYDDRSGSSREDKLAWYMSNAAALVINFNAADDTYAQRLWHTGVYKLDDDAGAGADAFAYVDGVSAGSSASLAAYSGLAPSSALSIGQATGGGFPLAGDIAQVLIYAAAHDDATRGQVEDWIDCTYGAMPQ